jgi:hypothetical protein
MFERNASSTGIVPGGGPVFDRLAAVYRMNLYVLLAIALGAITGVTDSRVTRPSLAGVVDECGIRADVQVADVSRGHVPHRHSESLVRAFAPMSMRRVDVPMAGATTPRAPSDNC